MMDTTQPQNKMGVPPSVRPKLKRVRKNSHVHITVIPKESMERKLKLRYPPSSHSPSAIALCIVGLMPACVLEGALMNGTHTEDLLLAEHGHVGSIGVGAAPFLRHELRLVRQLERARAWWLGVQPGFNGFCFVHAGIYKQPDATAMLHEFNGNKIVTRRGRRSTQVKI